MFFLYSDSLTVWGAKGLHILCLEHFVYFPSKKNQKTFAKFSSVMQGNTFPKRCTRHSHVYAAARNVWYPVSQLCCKCSQKSSLHGNHLKKTRRASLKSVLFCSGHERSVRVAHCCTVSSISTLPGSSIVCLTSSSPHRHTRVEVLNKGTSGLLWKKH